MARTTEDALCRAGLHPVLADGIENFVVVVVRRSGLDMIVDVAVVKLDELIRILGVIEAYVFDEPGCGAMASGSPLVSGDAAQSSALPA